MSRYLKAKALLEEFDVDKISMGGYHPMELYRETFEVKRVGPIWRASMVTYSTQDHLILPALRVVNYYGLTEISATKRTIKHLAILVLKWFPGNESNFLHGAFAHIVGESLLGASDNPIRSLFLEEPERASQ